MKTDGWTNRRTDITSRSHKALLWIPNKYIGKTFITSFRTNDCIFLNFSGCSSSMCAVHLSCESLRRGETSLAISSGVNLVLMVLNPLAGDDKEAVVLSKDHHCKTFDECKHHRYVQIDSMK